MEKVVRNQVTKKVKYEWPRISKNFQVVRPIVNAREILDLANQGKSIYVTVWKRNSPAAFLVAWQLRLVIKFIDNRWLYINKKYNHNFHCDKEKYENKEICNSQCAWCSVEDFN